MKAREKTPQNYPGKPPIERISFYMNDQHSCGEADLSQALNACWRALQLWEPTLTMLVRITHGVVQARDCRKLVLLDALITKLKEFQNLSVEGSNNFRQTVDGHAEVLGEEITQAFRDFNNAWMTFLHLWSQEPAGPTARAAYAEVQEMYRALSELSIRSGFTPVGGVFQDPAMAMKIDKSTMLWRYLTTAKLTDLLTTCSLYFCRTDLFGEPFEGSIPITAVTHDIHQMPTDRKFLNHFFFANCWHMNSHESVAMWKLYLRDEPGVAIQTTADRLASSLAWPQRGRLDLGRVEYVDYTTNSFDWLGPINAYFRKRTEYRYESEYRIVYHYFPPDYYTEISRRMLNAEYPLGVGTEHLNVGILMPAGIRIPVDLSLIERIVISPSTSPHFKEWTKAIIADAGFNVEVVHSALEASPRF